MDNINKLYLEISQITKARTMREQRLASCVRWLLDHGNAMSQRLLDNDGPKGRWEKQADIAAELLTDLDV